MLRTIAAAFAESALMPSPLAFWSMLAVCAAGLTIAVWFFSDQTLAISAGTYLARSCKDSHAIATHRTLALARTAADRPLLLILGLR